MCHEALVRCLHWRSKRPRTPWFGIFVLDRFHVIGYHTRPLIAMRENNGSDDKRA